MRARTALVELLTNEPEWRRFFKTLCEAGSFGLQSQTWQFRDELAEIGHRFDKSELENALLELARDLLPESPAARWDDAVDRGQLHPL